MMQRLLVLSLTMARVLARAEPHTDLGEGDSPCLHKPCEHGVCVESASSVQGYQCFCEDGYTGYNCETDWDECWNSPCLNGGTCLDGIAHYNCTCPPGFTGLRCQVNVDECSSDPCQNSGTCEDDVDGYICHCPKGFRGQDCEIDIQVCNMTRGLDEGGARCAHGGECVDGLGDSFTCLCTEGWTGDTCEVNIDECEEDPCLNEGHCMDLVGDFLCVCPLTWSGRVCEDRVEQCEDNPCLNDALCLVEEDTERGFRCYCVPDYHGPRCQHKYDECRLPPGPKCLHGGECVDDVDGFECQCEEGYSGDHCQCSAPEADSEYPEEVCVDVNTTLSWTIPPDYLPDYTDMGDMETTTQGEEVIHVADVEVTVGYDDVTQIMASVEDIEPTPSFPMASTDMMGNSSDSDMLTTDLVTDSDVSTEAGDPDLVTASIVPVSSDTGDLVTPALPGITETDRAGDISGEADLITDLTTEDTHFDNIATNDETLETGDKSTISDESESTTEAGVTSLSPQGQGRASSCANNVCRNGGTCLTSIDGFQCHCRLQFSGRHCEQEVAVETPGFVGHSYLVHNLNTNNKTVQDGVDIEIQFKTRHSEGILLLAGQEGKMFMTSYIEDGILHFKVSCGHQLITFSDPKHRVDTGEVHTLEMIVSLNLESEASEVPHTCQTVIKLNGTHTMRGEQETTWVPQLPEYLYLGGAPHDMLMFHDADLTIPAHGLRGCILSFVLAEAELDLFGEAVTGQDIIECDSAVCSSLPCHNSGVCNQDPSGTSWFCDCPAGFTGPLCERQVCSANPCLHGGTCIGQPEPGAGFICLCPHGRRGAICEESISLHQPSFTSWVAGYSSFLTYRTPDNVGMAFEAKFHFTTDTVNQVALLLFMGQKGTMRQGSDYLAVSYIKGHLLLTWDLGAGPRRIFTPAPVDQRIYVHSVHIGRWGRRAWLKVDHFRNISGLAPGKLADLNVNGEFFIGGHETYNFTRLPHDLPLHTGFTGCIFDLVLKDEAGEALVPVPTRGRNVQQCHERMCDVSPCGPGGSCLDYGASYTCECGEAGARGPSCDLDNVCARGSNQCQEGSTCVLDLATSGYQCVCPLGRQGQYCQENVRISDARFPGEHSWMALELVTAVRYNTHISLAIRPDHSDGMLLYMAQPHAAAGDYLSLLLVNGSLIFTYSLGSGDSVTTIRVPCCVELDTWHVISAGRHATQGYLQIDDTLVKGKSVEGLLTLDVAPRVYLGGLPDMSEVMERSGAGPEAEASLARYRGCMRSLYINEASYPLKVIRGRSGANILDCDGTVCGGEVCDNDGVCVLDTEAESGPGYHCQCQESYTGQHCQVHSLCQNNPCRNKAECKVLTGEEEFVCDCPLGYQGATCEDRIDVQIPRFTGDSYLQYTMADEDSVRHSTEIELEVRLGPEAGDGMILWLGVDPTADDYLGLGVEAGLLKVVWNLGWFSRTELVIPDTNLTDSSWHRVSLSRLGQMMDVSLDSVVHKSQVHGTYHQLDTTGTLMLGGAGNTEMLVQDLTRGHFTRGFQGCMRNIQIMEVFVDTTEGEHLLGQNIMECEG